MAISFVVTESARFRDEAAAICRQFPHVALFVETLHWHLARDPQKSGVSLGVEQDLMATEMYEVADYPIIKAWYLIEGSTVTLLSLTTCPRDVFDAGIPADN